MKIKNILLSLMGLSLATAISGCGNYTNFPAQYHISGTSSLIAKIAYPSAVAGSTASNASVTLPKLSLKGEPGSIGATFEKMDISYSVSDITTTSLPVSFRVDSSNFRDSAGKVVADGGTFELPVVNAKVLEYGKRQSVNNISALVTLTGTDDASWPTSITVNVPIVFLPSSSAGGAVTP